MKISSKPLYFSSGMLIGLWLAVLFIKIDFNATVAGLTEAGNTNWENLRAEMLDTIGLLIFGLLALSLVHLVILGILSLKNHQK